MRFSIAAAAALIAGASASSYSNGTSPVYVTEVVTAYTTYCPTPTSIVHGNQTYVVTEPTTLTITNCPCTVTKPAITTSVVSVCNTCTSAAPVVSSSAAPFNNGTMPASTPLITITSPGVAKPTAAPPATTSAYFNGANKAVTMSGAGLAALVGAVAYIL